MTAPPEWQPLAPAGTGYVKRGDPLPRVDGIGKVTGQARYAAEYPAPDLAWGMVVNSTVARGRIRALHVGEALAVPGVLDVLSHHNRPRVGKLDDYYQDENAPGGSPFKPFKNDEILYSGQPVALVVAETLEAARYAASLLRIEYERAPHETALLQHLERSRDPWKASLQLPEARGDAEAAFAASPVQVDAVFHAADQHHNPLEMHASTVHYARGDRLTIYDKSQGSQNCQKMLLQVFGLAPEQVTVKNLFVGGAFGSGLRPQYNLLLAVMAALHLGRSVRVMLTRQQMFTFGHRPETWQRVRLGASPDGALQAILHDCKAETSRFEDYTETVVDWSAHMYRVPSFRLSHQLVELDRYTPLDMRAPGATYGVQALEIVIDEMAHAAGMDPLAFRLSNYAETDPADGKPWSTRPLRECYRQAAERFGWSARAPAPRSRREGYEWVGWGMATGQWDALQMKAQARAVLHADGRLEVESAASDIGTGTYTVMTQIAAATLGLPMEQVSFRLGDSRLPHAPVEGGSSHVASVGSAVEGVCLELRRQLAQRAGMAGEDLECFEGSLRRRGDASSAVPIAQLLQSSGGQALQAQFSLQPEPAQEDKACAVHSAVFCEVRVDEDFGTVRVTRMVTAVAAGRIMNALTARSQVLGGMVWGIGHALHEATLCDDRLGRFMNHDLAKYHIATQADVHELDVIFVEDDDRVVSQLGAKGVGEIGIVGVAAAISNAIFHATGRRVRDTPMTPDRVMRPA